jgi:hypothetical protein
MNIKRISAYTLDKSTKKEFLNLEEYSTFKYGYKPTVIKFAKKMAAEFLKVYSFKNLTLNKDNLVLTTSPYWHTPPSAHSLAVNVHYFLNELLLESGHNALPFVKINRSSAPSCDFGKLSAKEREINMKKDSLSVDQDSVKGKTVILVEDSRITGAHEKKTISYLEKSGVAEIIFLYVIDVKTGKKDPEIENKMNHTKINSLDRLSALMRNPEEYILNARVCRFVLSWGNLLELKSFLKKISDDVLSDLYISSVNDGYGFMDKYQAGFSLVRDEIKLRENKISLASRFSQFTFLLRQAAVSIFF